MKKTLWMFAVMVLFVLTTGCYPDIIISEFEVGEVTAWTDPDDGKVYWVAPTTVRVENDDSDPCGDFSIAAKAGWQGDPDAGMYGWRFTTDEFEKSYKWHCDPLSSHEGMTYTGRMYIAECDPDLVGDTIDLWVHADPPVAARPRGDVVETDESNNYSVKFSKVMPSCA